MAVGVVRLVGDGLTEGRFPIRRYLQVDNVIEILGLYIVWRIIAVAMMLLLLVASICAFWVRRWSRRGLIWAATGLIVTLVLEFFCCSRPGYLFSHPEDSVGWVGHVARGITGAGRNDLPDVVKWAMWIGQLVYCAAVFYFFSRKPVVSLFEEP